MKILNVMIGLFLVLLIVPTVLAVVGTNLKITDLDVKVGSNSDKNIHDEEDGYTIDKEAKPGDIVKFSIEIENNYTSDIDIDDIEVTVTIEGIDGDDGDDLEEDAKDFDLRDGRNKDLDFEFEIPLEVEEDTYIVLITIEGTSKNNSIRTTHTIERTLELEVEKENDEVRFLRNSLTPSEIKCSRNVQLTTSVLNTGSDDQDDVTLEITNTELGISLMETFDLTSDTFDDDSKFRKTFTILIPEDVEAGIYTIPSKVTFEDGDSTETEIVELLVTQCEIFEEEEVEEEEVVVVQTPIDVITAGTVTTPTLTATEEKSLFQSSGFMVALIVGEILLVLIAILLVVAVVKKRSQ